MKQIRPKHALSYMAGLTGLLFIALMLVVSQGVTATENRIGDTEIIPPDDSALTKVYYIPIVRKDPTPSPTPRPLITPVPGATNLLPNPSFEGGWYHPDPYISEIQIPNQWRLAWDEGENPLDPAPWNAFVRPESRLLSADFLPPAEHDLFIWDGTWTVKVFKDSGALSFRLSTDVVLPPGEYLLNIHIFPDLIVAYTDEGEKIWAPDPLSGEVRFVIDGESSNWILPKFGQKNILQAIFEVPNQQQVELTVAIRGRWAIRNNGWFMDDWSLTKMN